MEEEEEEIHYVHTASNEEKSAMHSMHSYDAWGPLTMAKTRAKRDFSSLCHMKVFHGKTSWHHENPGKSLHAVNFCEGFLT